MRESETLVNSNAACSGAHPNRGDGAGAARERAPANDFRFDLPLENERARERGREGVRVRHIARET